VGKFIKYGPKLVVAEGVLLRAASVETIRPDVTRIDKLVKVRVWPDGPEVKDFFELALDSVALRSNQP
jgi:hypothetical protein